MNTGAVGVASYSPVSLIDVEPSVDGRNHHGNIHEIDT